MCLYYENQCPVSSAIPTGHISGVAAAATRAVRPLRGMEMMIGEHTPGIAGGAAAAPPLTAAQIGSLLPQDSDQDLLGGVAAKKEREVIESNRVKLANYIHDVTTLFPLLRQEGIFSRDDVDIIEAPVTTTAKVDMFLDVLLRKG